MRRLIFPLFIFLPMAFLPVACGSPNPPPPKGNGKDATKPTTGQSKETSQPLERPAPPLQLAVPTAMPEKMEGQDLKTWEEGDLLGRANQAMAKRDYSRAATYQYWYVQKSDKGRYNLACFLARIGQVDPAFYWLQLAALEEGVDTQHALMDEDLTSLRRDPRWAKVQQFLASCNRYFESAAIVRTVLLLPKDYKKEASIPAVLWLHGYSSRPDDFVNPGSQDYADALKVALIGVSGTMSRGPRSFVWTEDPEKDAKRMRDALAEVSDRVTVTKGHVITLGFSQGAQVGLEVAVRNPGEYAGSIVLSPGILTFSRLDNLKPSPLLAQRGFVLSCGANEHPSNVQLTAADANWLRKAKAQVIHKMYPGVSAHSFPKDFDERFSEWVKFILKPREE
jgi:predicted esterase